MISVVIPTYNRMNILPRAVDSVLGQSFKDYEILIVDDGSTDGTEMLFSKGLYANDNRICYFRLPVNSGVHTARNYGIEHARGEFIVLLDSDDELFSSAVSNAIIQFELDHKIGLVLGAFIKNNSQQLTGFDVRENKYIEYQDYLCGKEMSKYKNQFVMIRGDIIGNTRYVMQNLDFIFFRRIAKKTKVFFMASPVGIYHIDNNEDSLHKKRNKLNLNLSIKRAIELDLFLDEFGKDIISMCSKNYSTYAYGAAVGLLLNNKKRQAIKRAIEAYKYTRQTKYLIFMIFTMTPFSSVLLRFLFKLSAFTRRS